MFLDSRQSSWPSATVVGHSAPGVCRESGSGTLQSREARLQGAALELSLPVVHVDGLAVSRREAAGGGALSGVMNCLAAPVALGLMWVWVLQLVGAVGG